MTINCFTLSQCKKFDTKFSLMGRLFVKEKLYFDKDAYIELILVFITGAK